VQGRVYHQRLPIRRESQEWVLLKLTRQLNESLRVGDEVTVTVIAIKCNQVRIGIDAPKYVEQHREEIVERVQQEKMRQSDLAD
jgi:carbon storage regulator